MTRLSEKEANYWANVFISIGQVLFGISAVTFFTGGLDLIKDFVIIYCLVLSAYCWYIGWRLIKNDRA